MKVKAGPWIAGGLVLLVLAGLGWLIYSRVAASLEGGGERERGQPAVAVEVAPVQRQTVRDVRTFTGTLTPRAEFTIAPKIAGRLEALAVNIGDLVEPGQVVARLDDDELQLQVEQAQAELVVARANLQQARSQWEVAQRDYERIASLREQRVASESELDQARARLDSQEAAQAVAQAQVTRAQAALKAAEVRLSYAQVRATWEEDEEEDARLRVVGERFADEGDMLAANAPVVSILDIATLIAVIYAGERDYPQLRIDQPVQLVADALPDEPVAGQVIRLAPRFRESSRQARVEVQVPNPDRRLKPGMFVRCRVELGRSEDALVVPLEAVVTREGRRGVFLVNPEESTAQFVPLRLGIEDGGWVEVLEPAVSGRVVTLGQHLLSDGSAVALPEASSQATGGTAPGGGPATEGAR